MNDTEIWDTWKGVEWEVGTVKLMVWRTGSHAQAHLVLSRAFVVFLDNMQLIVHGTFLRDLEVKDKTNLEIKAKPEITR